MEKRYEHKKIEPEIYKLWEDNDAFSPEGASKIRRAQKGQENNKPYSVLMPPPNANASLHCGHATYAIQDLMVRFKRMQGYDTCYFPGTDHAGFETQVVYEKHLKKEGKSRFDFDSQTLYKKILDFVNENSTIATNQLKRIGMSADWGRNTFMLDKKVINTVYDTFIKMHKEGLVFRDGYMVNYSTFYGTTFSDLETEYKDSISPLYYIKYQIKNTKGTIIVATVRPETIYADTAIAVNPKDDRYKELVGGFAINPLNGNELPIIEDDYVDIKFGTGVLKITPGHDINDFKIGKKHNLKVISLINLDGTMNDFCGGCVGLYPNQARKKTAEILRENGAIDKVDENYSNRVLVDYKEGRPIEPMILPNWFVDMEDMSDMAIDAVEKEDIIFNNSLWKKEILRWLKEKKPWPISRQTVFGVRIPAWYPIEGNEKDISVSFIDKKGRKKQGAMFTGDLNILTNGPDGFTLEEIKDGLQKIYVKESVKPIVQKGMPGENYIQETDTFDTWFSSGQWPFTTTNFPKGGDYKRFFPTSFLDSMWDIMFFWIARMLMISLYLTKDDKGGPKVPFKKVYFHGAITDKNGKKMSKSKGNVINPLELTEKYGADALRMGILVGGNTASRYTPLDEDKVRGYRNFANKIWNIARFINISNEGNLIPASLPLKDLLEEDQKIIGESIQLSSSVTKKLDKYQFKLAGEEVYEFLWNRLANEYLEKIKNRNDLASKTTLSIVFKSSLKLLHPFMPFITEAVWKELPGNKNRLLIVESWD